MKPKLIPIGVVLAGVIAALIFAYTQMSKERVADEEADQPVSSASGVQTDANGETFVTLDLKTQQLIGLQAVTLTNATLPMGMKAYGHVLDSATLVSLHSDFVAAGAALKASSEEYERLEKLSALDNTSAHTLEEAEAQMKHDQSALDAAEAQLVAASGKAVLQEPADFFQALGRQESTLLRLDLPAGEAPVETPIAAKLDLPKMEQPVAAGFVGYAATTDPLVQGAGFIFVVTNAPANLVSGLAVTGFIQMPGDRAQGVIVPDEAVVRSDDNSWIYIQTNETNFMRRKIVLNYPADNDWFITNGVTAGDKVVIVGAQVLLSEEHKKEIHLED